MALRIYRKFNLLDLIEITGACAGLMSGLMPFLKRGHWLLGIFTGIALGIVFYLVARIPRIIADALVTKWVRSKDTQQLKRMLEEDYQLITYIILELIRRKEDLSHVKECLFKHLSLNCDERRKCGWNNLCLFYPELAKQIENYDPYSSLDQCQMILKKLKNT